VGGALHSYCQPHSIGLALGLEIADPCLIVFLHASLRLLAIRPTAKLDQHLGTPQRLVTHGPSPRAWGSRERDVERFPGKRSIPTCVGLTPRQPRRGPRQIGPSPRAWDSHR